MEEITTTLTKIGLDNSDAVIYTTLAQHGTLGIAALMEHTGFSRVTINDSAKTLQTHKLITSTKSGREVFYTAAHPATLSALGEQKEEETTELLRTLEQQIQTLTGAYNLQVGKPGVRLLEGEDGFREALFASLNTSGTIYTVANDDIVDRYLTKINVEYVDERLKRGIPKKMILTRNPRTIAFKAKMDGELTHVRLIDGEKNPFELATELYDDTMTYLTVTNESKVAVQIHHPHIAQYHRMLFDYIWNTLES